MSPTCKLFKDEHDKSVDQKLYRRMIGSLLQLTVSRLDILLSICMCARIQAEQKESNLKSIKKIIKYLKGIENTRLWYSKQSIFELIGYSDLDYAGCRLDRKSISRLS